MNCGRTSARRPKWPIGSSRMDDRTHHLVSPVRFRGGGFDPKARTLVSWLSFAVLLLVWQAASSAGLINPIFLPSPLAIAATLKEIAVSGELFRHLVASLLRIG